MGVSNAAKNSIGVNMPSIHKMQAPSNLGLSGKYSLNCKLPVSYSVI